MEGEGGVKTFLSSSSRFGMGGGATPGPGAYKVDEHVNLVEELKRKRITR